MERTMPIEAPAWHRPDRSGLEERIARVRASLESCTLCPLLCRVDRLAGPAGRCLLPATGRVFFHGPLLGEELCITPTYGVSFSGCNLRCRFCNVDEHVRRPLAVPEVNVAAIARGLHSMSRVETRSFVGGEPSVNLLAALEVLAALDHPPPVVWNSNLYVEPVVLEMLAGLVGVYLVDLHFGNDACAERIASVPHYLATMQDAVARASTDAPVIVRHLLLPGHVACCFEPLVRWLEDDLPQVSLRLMTHYQPAGPARHTASLAVRPDACEVARARAALDATALQVVIA